VAGPIANPAKQRGVAVLGATDKVAALLLAMGRQAAASVLQQFEPQEIRIVTKAAAELRPITAQELESIVEEFAQQFSMGANILGTLGGIEAVLGDVLPADQVSAIMSDLLGNSSRSVWDRVSSVSENSLASYLSKEHPQTAAVILSKVKPACAAKVMSQLPSGLRNELMRRVLSLKPIVDDAMRILEKTLHEDLTLNFARNLGADTYARVADIINKMERGLRDLIANKPAEGFRGVYLEGALNATRKNILAPGSIGVISGPVAWWIWGFMVARWVVGALR